MSVFSSKGPISVGDGALKPVSPAIRSKIWAPCVSTTSGADLCVGKGPPCSKSQGRCLFKEQAERTGGVCVCVCVCGCGVAWRGVAWRGVAWRGVAWRGVVWCGVVCVRGCVCVCVCLVFFEGTLFGLIFKGKPEEINQSIILGTPHLDTYTQGPLRLWLHQYDCRMLQDSCKGQQYKATQQLQSSKMHSAYVHLRHAMLSCFLSM